MSKYRKAGPPGTASLGNRKPTVVTMANALTAELMHEMWPHGDQQVPGLIDGIVNTLPQVFAKYAIDSDLMLAHFLAQWSEECGAGIEMVENMNYSAV